MAFNRSSRSKGGFGAQPQQGGFGAQPQQGYGQPSQQGGFGGNAQNALGNLAGQIGGEDIQYQPGLKTKTAGLDHNLAALLAHITPAGLVWIFAEEKTPQNRWLRFLSFQAIFAGVAIGVIQSILVTVLGFISGTLAGLVSMLISLATLVLFILTALKAHKGGTPRLPVVSKFAAKYA